MMIRIQCDGCGDELVGDYSKVIKEIYRLKVPESNDFVGELIFCSVECLASTVTGVSDHPVEQKDLVEEEPEKIEFDQAPRGANLAKLTKEQLEAATGVSVKR